MKKYSAVYSKLRVYYSRDFVKFNPDEMINLSE